MQVHLLLKWWLLRCFFGSHWKDWKEKFEGDATLAKICSYRACIRRSNQWCGWKLRLGVPGSLARLCDLCVRVFVPKSLFYDFLFWGAKVYTRPQTTIFVYTCIYIYMCINIYIYVHIYTQEKIYVILQFSTSINNTWNLSWYHQNQRTPSFQGSRIWGQLRWTAWIRLRFEWYPRGWWFRAAGSTTGDVVMEPWLVVWGYGGS